MTTKIQRWQCAAFARILEDIVEKTENEDISRYWDNPKRDQEKKRLEKEYRLKELEHAKDEADEKYRNTDKRVDEALNRFDAQAEQKKRAKIRTLTLAIRDIWVCESVEEAKKIVERFVAEE